VVASDANGAATSDENVRSVAVKISFGALDLLVGGDLPATGPNVEASIGADVGPVEIYKVHHHGSAGASGANVLAAIKPTVGLISVSANNSYGHPAPAALARLAAVHSAVWQTAGTASTRGHLEVVSRDGSGFTVSKNSETATSASK
jgi:beta-lactamase superfamily II metal-dependent hydrolase